MELYLEFDVDDDDIYVEMKMKYPVFKSEYVYSKFQWTKSWLLCAITKRVNACHESNLQTWALSC